MLEKMKEIIAEQLGVEEDEITPDTSFKEDLGADSLDLFELTLGSSYSMRGYYEGRYRDKGAMDAQIELRQHVWKRNGVAVWAGAGTIFPRLSEFTPKHILPNYGFGYRWEFKKRVNVRLDLGFGKHQTGFIFNINEAF